MLCFFFLLDTVPERHEARGRTTATTAPDEPAKESNIAASSAAL